MPFLKMRLSKFVALVLSRIVLPVDATRPIGG